MSNLKVTFLLDGSTSMQGYKWAEAIKSVNAYVAGLQDQPHTEVQVMMFKDANKSYPARGRGWNITPNIEAAGGVEPEVGSNATLIHMRSALVKNWTPISVIEFSPEGNTPLNDASYDLLQSVQFNGFEKNIVVIVTDGAENSSRKYSKADVQTLINAFEAREWEVLFIGANFEAVIDQAAGYGTQFAKSMPVDMAFMADTMADLGDMTRSYATAGTRMEFSNATRAKAKGAK